MDREQRRAQILGIAKEVFAQKGYHDARIDDIVVRAGVARLVCDSGHTWMVAYVHAFNHPYHTVTDANGAYSIPGVTWGSLSVVFTKAGFAARTTKGSVTKRRTSTIEGGAKTTRSP